METTTLSGSQVVTAPTEWHLESMEKEMILGLVEMRNNGPGNWVVRGRTRWLPDISTCSIYNTTFCSPL